VQYRLWQSSNLLVEFDEKGIVRRSQIVPDSRIIPAVQRIVKGIGNTPPPSDEPLLLHLETYRTTAGVCTLGTIQIVRGKMELAGGDGCSPASTIDPRTLSIGAARAWGPTGSQRDFTDLQVTLLLGHQNPSVGNVTLVARSPAIVSLMRFLALSRSASP
jgi:hypothetical protein